MAWGQEPAPPVRSATTQPATSRDGTDAIRDSSPRQVIDQALPQVTKLLLDRSLPSGERAEHLQAIIRRRIDFASLSRIMLAQAWDGLEQKQRDDFVEVFSDYLLGVYEPLMDLYTGQQVRVSEDYPVGRADHMVITKVSDQKGGSERQIALLAFRMRRGEEGWKAIDVTVEGISVARVFGAQFRPVLARDGMDGLLRQLREKNAGNKHH